MFMERFTVEPVASLWVIGLIVAVMIAAVLLGPSFANLSREQRKKLLILRGIVIAMAFLAMLRPGIVSKISQSQTAVLAILMDFSRSMRLPHQSTGPSRWDSMVNMINNNRALLQEIEDQNIEVRYYGFGSDLIPLTESDQEVQWPDSATAGETDMGSSLYWIVDSVRDQRLLAIVLAGDGVQNVSNPEVELSQAAQVVSDSQTPLFTVPLGQPAENEQFADIALSNMADQYTVWVKNDLTVTATVEARGFANREIPVQLIVIDETGQETLVDTVRKQFTKQNETVPVELKYTPDVAGQFRLIVRAEAQEQEISPRNNELPAFLTVNEGGLRVLYLYGSLNWEQAFIRRALGAYPDIQLDAHYVDARNFQSSLRASNLQHLFGDPQYDVFILHDVDSRALYQKDLQEENLALLIDAVAKGKGLMMIGGFHSFGPGLYHSTPLKDLLPVTMEFFEQQEFEPAKIRKDLHLNEPIYVRVATPHFVTRLGGTDENAAIWQQLPPLDGANRFIGLKDSAGGVLLESTNGDPLLVSAQIGGRVLAFAGDTTYKWWTHGFRDIHKRFWRQIILWLAFKDTAAGENIVIDLPQRRFEPNSTVRFTVSAKTKTEQNITDVQLEGQLVAPDGTKSSINISTGQNISEINRKLLATPGIYAIEITGKRNGQTIGTAQREFAVFDNDKEQSLAGADPDTLNRLAERTSPWGGKMVEPVEFPKLLEEFANQPPKMKIDVPLKWQLGDTWYDALLFVLLFVGMISAEWYLRKKWGLV